MKMFRLGIFFVLLLGGGLAWLISAYCEDDWCYIFPWQKTGMSQEATFTFASENVRVESPRVNQIIKSPLEISGSAHGIWSFEASFPVRFR